MMRDRTFTPDRADTATARTALRLDRDAAVALGDAAPEIFAAARAAGALAAKRTAEVIPSAPPPGLTAVELALAVDGVTVTVVARCATLGPADGRIAAAHAAMIGALTVADQLVDRVASGLGGAPSELGWSVDATTVDAPRVLHAKPLPGGPLRVVILRATPAVARGEKPDRGGATLRELLAERGELAVVHDLPIDAPPAFAASFERAWEQVLAEAPDLLLTVGGTGLGRDDALIDAIEARLTLEIPGMMEAARAFGQRRSPSALRSRGVAGFAGETLVITLPGSSSGVRETAGFLLPHAIAILSGRRRHA